MFEGHKANYNKDSRFAPSGLLDLPDMQFWIGSKKIRDKCFFADLPLHWHEAGMLFNDKWVFSGPKNRITV